MGRQLFNDGWSFMYQSVEGYDKPLPSEEITLPHDAVINLERFAKQSNGNAKGFFPNVRLLYAKKFYVGSEMKGKYLCLQFDGVYQNAKVIVNGNYAGRCNYGYERFYVDIYPYLNYDAENEVVVEVSSGDDSRWYTGAGIYRNVYLITADALHFAHGGVKISTKEVSSQVATLETRFNLINENLLSETVEIITEIIDMDNTVAAVDRRRVSVPGHDQAEIRGRIYVNNPKLWDVDNPNLYTCKARIMKDEEILDEEVFQTGIRVLSLDPVHGLCINGKNLKMYGGCVHHDNGIVGSAAFKAAEDRKVRLLKEAGYNALRFSHNPMSDELMEACDRYGLVVMDELTDIWNMSKSSKDFSITFEEDWKKAVTSMVDKSYNHPSVIMYSIGNEIMELGYLAGRKLGRELAAEFRHLDSSRYITCGINGLACLMPPTSVSDPTQVDPQEINAMMSQMISQIGVMQCQDTVVEGLQEFSEVLDIVGYNYAEDKQLLDMDKFTNRICVGSETFPKSIAKNWKLMQDYPAIIGDFAWTAWDYLGEAGIGKNGVSGDWSAGIYEGYPYKLANCGDIDIAGSRRPQSYYRECVIGKRKIYVSVVNPERYGKEIDTTPWSWSDSVSSWSWNGYEGKLVQVEVYGIGDVAELVVNGVSIGKQDIPQVSAEGVNAYCTVFDTTYQPGKMEAVLYTEGKETGRFELTTASEKLQLSMENQSENLGDDLKDLLYFEISLTDDKGILKPMCDREVTVTVEGAGKLQGFGSAAPLSTERFGDGKFTTYYGKAALAVRPTGDGEIHIKVQADGCETVELSI